MKLQFSTSTGSGSLVNLATALLAVLLLITGHVPVISALVPSGGEKSPSDVLFCGRSRSWRKMFPGKDYRCSGSESLSISSARKFPSRSLRADKIPPHVPSPTSNLGKQQATPPPDRKNL